jgi:hypothetical protein
LQCFIHIADGDVYSIQPYVIKLVRELWQVDCFLRVLRFPPPLKSGIPVDWYFALCETLFLFLFFWLLYAPSFDVWLMMFTIVKLFVDMTTNLILKTLTCPSQVLRLPNIHTWSVEVSQLISWYMSRFSLLIYWNNNWQHLPQCPCIRRCTILVHSLWSLVIRSISESSQLILHAQ